MWFCYKERKSFVFLQLFQPDQHGGLIFTSPRAVEAVKMCVESSARKQGQWISHEICN